MDKEIRKYKCPLLWEGGGVKRYVLNPKCVVPARSVGSTDFIRCVVSQIPTVWLALSDGSIINRLYIIFQLQNLIILSKIHSYTMQKVNTTVETKGEIS